VVSETKNRIISQHQENSQLNTPLLSQVMQNDMDLAADDLISPLDEQIIAGASEALEAGETHYVAVPGIGPLRESIAEYLNSESGSQYKDSNILVTAGVQESRFLTIQKISELYDSIGVPEVVHPGVAKALGVRTRKVVELPIDFGNGALASLDTISSAIDSGCQLLYLESPSRLTGAVYTREEVDQIAEIAATNGVGIIWDQGLSTWVADGEYASIAPLDADTSQTATIGEAWPGMGLASWFIGYIAAPEDWVQSMQSQKQIMAICTSTATQYAALEASKLYAATHSQQLQQLNDIKTSLVDFANSANLEVMTGSTANLLALNLSALDKTSILTRLSESGFAVADGDHFGAPDIIRVNVSLPTENAIQQIS
jgi:aspartate aminotransferase